ncbi:MAG: GNAT family N-acetyltransferase [Chloroflexi bacterium]|nr:GNAT family N-acetyltransferase [Chloroflexota bacterium]
MTDMLVKLYELPPLAPALEQCAAVGVDIRRALPVEKHVILNWIAQHFSQHWVSECDAAMARFPAACFVATEGETLIGFACYDAGAKGIFGPTGVSEQARGKGAGKALLLACLHDMLAQGYAYAVIGWTGPQEFYAKVCGATPIEGSRPGMYRGMLK